MYASDCIPIFLMAFLVGSIPFGVLLARIFRLPDPRGLGSGNIGATNMLRTGNKKVALLTLVLDGLKGALPVLFVLTTLRGPAALAAVAMLGAVLGHCYTPWLKFKGGKGVATALGGMIALNLTVGVLACFVWVCVAAVTRYVSLASIAAGFAMAAFATAWLNVSAAVLLLIVALLIAHKHRPNLQRLRAGTEPKLGAKNHA
jgi:glycerol-3-phosphate acyltransferase PlsY